MDKCRAERECQQCNKRDDGQSAVVHWLAPTFFGDCFGTVAAGVEEAMFESPILGNNIFGKMDPQPIDWR